MTGSDGPAVLLGTTWGPRAARELRTARPSLPGWPSATLDPHPDQVIKREPRTLVWRESGPDGTPRVVKMYRRRGRVTAFREELLGFRAEREFRRLKHLVRWGVPCTEPIAWAHGYSAEHGWHELLVTREVPDAVPLGAFLGGARGSPDLRPLLHALRRMHEAGFCHQTLFARNVVVRARETGPPGYFLLDVPRSWIFPRSIVGSRPALADLRDLFVDLKEEGVPREEVPWDAYGLPAKQVERITRPWESDPRTKWNRILRDAVVRVRWAAAWLRP